MKRRKILVVSLGGVNHSFWVKNILTFSERMRSNLSLRSFLWKTWEEPYRENTRENVFFFSYLRTFLTWVMGDFSSILESLSGVGTVS